MRRAWARLIRKIYAADPLVCPRCGGHMKVIAVIDQEDVIYRILSHLGLLLTQEPSRSPPDDIALPAARKELIYVPVYDGLPFPEAA